MKTGDGGQKVRRSEVETAENIYPFQLKAVLGKHGAESTPVEHPGREPGSTGQEELRAEVEKSRRLEDRKLRRAGAILKSNAADPKDSGFLRKGDRAEGGEPPREDRIQNKGITGIKDWGIESTEDKTRYSSLATCRFLPVTFH